MFGTTNTGMTGIQFQNTSVTFELQSTPDYADYPYRGAYANSGITSNAYANVVYSGTQVASGHYAPFCKTEDGYVYLYANAAVGIQTIPTINVGQASFSLTLDNSPTEGSNNPVSSGGVYNAMWSNSPFGLPLTQILDMGTFAVNKCKCEKAPQAYIADVDGYIFCGGSDSYTGSSWVRVGKNKTNYFQFNYYYDDENSYTRASCILVPVRKGQWFLAWGLESQNSSGNDAFDGFCINGTYYNAGSSYSYWFIPARVSDLYNLSYRTATST